ncbi:hypothetical protein MRX96_010386 [Rhipicephalus microplus]
MRLNLFLLCEWWNQLSIPRFRPTLPSSPVLGEQGGCRSSRTSSGAQGLARERGTLIFGNRRRERKSQQGLGRGGSRRDRPFVSNHFLLSRKRPPSIHLGPRSAGGTSLVGCFVSPIFHPGVFDRPPPRRTAWPDGRLPSCRATIRDGDVAQPSKTPFRAQSRFEERRRALPTSTAARSDFCLPARELEKRPENELEGGLDKCDARQGLCRHTVLLNKHRVCYTTKHVEVRKKQERKKTLKYFGESTLNIADLIEDKFDGKAIVHKR